MSFAPTAEAAFQYWAQLDNPTSLKLFLMGKAGDWLGVVNSSVNTSNYASPTACAGALAAVAFLKKNPGVPGTSQQMRKQAALDSFKAGEKSCYIANERLSPHLISPLSDDRLSKFLRQVRGRMLEWLGPCPSDESLQKSQRHGPGKTFESQVVYPTTADKFSEAITLTSGAVYNLVDVFGTMWGPILADRHASGASWYNVVRGNRFTSVPKTSLTDRGIGIEPMLNVYVQLGIGAAIRRRLRQNCGWDLDNAAAIHRKMAQEASYNGYYATIDLKNASDSLCKNLVRILLHGTGWLELLESVRSPMTRVEDQWHLLEKFSSMGNGYTFELESCVFAAICSVVLEVEGYSGLLGFDLFVFGDDIIVPTRCSESVIAALRWCGFEINESKSFVSGSFKESCGGDFFNGEPVRAFYLKKVLAYGTQSIFTVHNGTKVTLVRCGIFDAWYTGWLRDTFLPTRLRSFGGPERLGDTVLHGLQAKSRWKDGIRWVRSVKWSEPRITAWTFFSVKVRLACRLTGYGDTHGISGRGAISVVSSQWVSDS